MASEDSRCDAFPVIPKKLTLNRNQPFLLIVRTGHIVTLTPFCAEVR